MGVSTTPLLHHTTTHHIHRLRCLILLGTGASLLVLHGILGGPLPRRAVVAGPVGLQKLSDIRDEGIVGIGIGEEGADAEQDLGDGEGGGPLVLEDVEADPAVGVDVAVVDAGGEVDLGGFEGVVGGEVDVEEEDSAGVRRVVGPHDGGLPVEHIIADGTGRAVCRRILPQIDQFLIDSLQRHGCW
eukprot:CAMPEP_0178713152 /NCGR_PEP_ID=MMETSP0699-20121125/19261_1 /TAXON_ID=265572 /ORGANISM="Extubocellulus spinifer, Strain CCMP396" /LENGTH=185 /DNA_ID=CAMNT_0020361947 /DNA_START=864 /DNA_END=1418 /DNA_ORIENTATION=+